MAEITSTDQELKVLTTVAMKGVLEMLAAEFRQRTLCRLSTSYGPGGIVLGRVQAGEIHDVVIATPDVIETLIAEGHLAAGSERVIARSIIGIAVRAGATRPRMENADDFRRALLQARAVAYTNPATGAASGMHVAKILEQFGIAREVSAKAKPGDGGPVAEYVARGEADLAIQQLCEHMLVPGVDIIGPLPAELQKVTTLTATAGAASSAPGPALELVRLLLGARVQAGMAMRGLEPVCAAIGTRS